mgnify:CR=1 FL=1
MLLMDNIKYLIKQSNGIHLDEPKLMYFLKSEFRLNVDANYLLF